MVPFVVPVHDKKFSVHREVLFLPWPFQVISTLSWWCFIQSEPCQVPNYGRRHSAVPSLPRAAAWLACYFEYHLNIFPVFLFPASGSLSFCCWGPCAQGHSSFRIRTPSWTVRMGIPGTWSFCFYTCKSLQKYGPVSYVVNYWFFSELKTVEVLGI